MVLVQRYVLLVGKDILPLTGHENLVNIVRVEVAAAVLYDAARILLKQCN